MQSSWSEERIALLEQMVPQGHSYTICAARISALPGPRISRNAAIGKATRLGIAQKRVCRPGMRKKGATKPRPMYLSAEHRALAQERIEAFRAQPDIVVPENERRKLLDLEAGDCRWPIGDPREPGFHFCNRLQIGTESRMRRGTSRYCQFHFARAFDPPRPRRHAQFPAPATVADKETV